MKNLAHLAKANVVCVSVILLVLHRVYGFAYDDLSMASNICYTCLRPDSLNENVSCWTDRITRAVDCKAPENKCINLVINGNPDFLSLRRDCQPPEAAFNPCLFIRDYSLQVAGSQRYTVNGQASKCMCFDVCDPTDHQELFNVDHLNVQLAEQMNSIETGDVGNCSWAPPQLRSLRSISSTNICSYHIWVTASLAVMLVFMAL